ncbi:helix-turn-helix domain-containing protein [uncultured Ruthenibacterium sp.]|uniref:helix-turn-helix domain-containing protein n=1 Tax=uncultured Ruthenibacterium sp. TaxID=1905347 RepID=UPI00349ECCE1
MGEVERNINGKIKDIAVKLRRIRERKGLTREKFCEPLGENSEYWGLIERGEQPISLVKLLQVCEVYDIPLESVVTLDYTEDARNDLYLRQDIAGLLDQCKGRQLEVIHKFIEDIALSL